MMWKRLRKGRQRIATSHINALFELAIKSLDNHPERSRRYIEIARNISRKHKVSPSRLQKRMFCKSCNIPLVPGKTARIRTRNDRTIITCMECGNIKRIPFRREKIRCNSTTKHYAEYKAKGGLLCVSLSYSGDRINDISITGDFFFYPEEKFPLLKECLTGIRFVDIEDSLNAFFKRESVEMPGVKVSDILNAINKAKN